MAEKTSYIRIDRNILRWRWWTDHNTLIVFLYLLLEANISEHGFSGITIHRGELATSLQNISRSTTLSIRSVRTAISHLKMTGEVTSKLYPKFQVITICNYDKYQSLTSKTTNKVTGKRQASDKQATTIKEIREGKNKENNNSRFAPDSPSEITTYPYPCGVSEQPDWLDDDEWEQIQLKSIQDIPGTLQGDYSRFIDYYKAKKEGKVK